MKCPFCLAFPWKAILILSGLSWWWLINGHPSTYIFTSYTQSSTHTKQTQAKGPLSVSMLCCLLHLKAKLSLCRSSRCLQAPGMPHQVKGAHEPFPCVCVCVSERYIFAHCCNKRPSSDSFGQLPNLFWSFWNQLGVSLRAAGDVMGQQEQYGSGHMPKPYQ